MVKVKDILELFSCNVQIVNKDFYILDIDYSLNMDGRRADVLSEEILNETVVHIECEHDKAFLIL